MTEEELGIPVCGYLPKMEDMDLESRHLGLVMPGEIKKWKDKLKKLERQCLASLDLPLLEKIASIAPDMEEREIRIPAANMPQKPLQKPPVIAVAKDAAFSFYYKDNLRLLEKLGAQLLEFSPLNDREIPREADALLLGGGYPELHGECLEENLPMRQSVKQALSSGMPCMAECGGFLYLQEEMEDPEGRHCKMAGFLPGKSFYKGRLSRFGYVSLTAQKDGAFAKEKESIRGHEFHYMDTDANGDAFQACKPITGRNWECGVTGESFYAGFPHLYLYSMPDFAGRFVRKAEEYGKNRRKQQL